MPRADLDRLIAERTSPAVKDALRNLLEAPAPVAARGGGRRSAAAPRTNGGGRAQRAAGPAGPDGAVLESVRQAIAAAGGSAGKAEVLAATGLADADWTAAIAALLAAGTVTKTGAARATRYHLNPEPRTPNPEPRTPNPEPRTPNPEPRTPNPMHPFHDYLCEHLDELLRKRSVVVFYDPRNEFAPFFDRELETGADEPLPRVTIAGRAVYLARHTGSFFGLRAAVEPIVAADRPESLILYLPGITRDRAGSVLMELERAGACYEPPLRRLALNVLRQRFTDGQIDELLRPASLTYDDIVAYLNGDGGAAPSALHSLFGGAQGEALLIAWLASDAKDGDLVEKEAMPELLKLIKVRLGLDLPGGTAVSKARERTCRYCLVNEFRADLSCEPPKSIGMIPSPPGKAEAERMKLLKAKVPDAVEMTLGKLLGSSPAKVAKEIGSASLIVIRSQEIDFLGEADGDLLARQVMDTVIGNLARGVKKLAAAGVERFVITANHGHQFSVRKEDDMKTDKPGGATLDLHRRCWIGHGGSVPTGAVRVPGAELGYQTNLDFVFPTGLGVFKAGGGLSFHHGGFSLQELIVPVISSCWIGCT